MNMSILFYAVKFGNLCRNMPCNNCAFIRVVFFRELYFEEMCGSAETTQKSKRSRSQNQPDLLHENWKQLRRVSGAEACVTPFPALQHLKQLRRVSGAEVSSYISFFLQFFETTQKSKWSKQLS